ncbi:MAG: hypothetical protein D6733_05265 [Methanobacteriota archaeon]|nr:MAG: hypothetical protein D6733_05265 [Euryarchaeota archaeon]
MVSLVKRVSWIGFSLSAALLLYLPASYGEPPPTVVPPPAAVPEGNVFTLTAFVASGLYLLWLKGRRGG